MCLGLPGRIISVDADSDIARVEVAGVIREIDMALLHGTFTPGEFILIHSGIALERMSSEQAREALAIFGDDQQVGAYPPAEDELR